MLNAIWYLILASLLAALVVGIPPLGLVVVGGAAFGFAWRHFQSEHAKKIAPLHR